MNYQIAWETLKENTLNDLANFEKERTYLNANICRMILDSMGKIENSLTDVEPDKSVVQPVSADGLAG
jgi:hypothetical protein